METKWEDGNTLQSLDSREMADVKEKEMFKNECKENNAGTRISLAPQANHVIEKQIKRLNRLTY